MTRRFMASCHVIMLCRGVTPCRDDMSSRHGVMTCHHDMSSRHGIMTCRYAIHIHVFTNLGLKVKLHEFSPRPACVAARPERTISGRGVVKSNSITIRKRILAGSKVGSGRGRAYALYYVRTLPTHPRVSAIV